MREGHVVDPAVLNAEAGPEHCEWQAMTFLLVSWPLGTVARTAQSSRSYVRAVTAPAGFHLKGEFVAHAHLPADAHPSGYRSGNVELWIGGDVDQAVYLVAAADHSDAERWPRDDPQSFCA